MITTIDQLQEFLSSIKCEDGNETIASLKKKYQAELEKFALSHLGQMNENKNIRASLTLELRLLQEKINEIKGEHGQFFIIGMNVRQEARR